MTPTSPNSSENIGQLWGVLYERHPVEKRLTISSVDGLEDVLPWVRMRHVCT